MRVATSRWALFPTSIAFAILLFLVLALHYRPKKVLDFPERELLVSIVEAVRQYPFVGEKGFALPSLAQPEKLQPADFWEVRDGIPIKAERDAEGKLTVLIVTGGNHWESSGFLYSDAIPQPEKAAEDLYYFPIIGRIWKTTIHLRIDDHWWKVFRNEDEE